MEEVMVLEAELEEGEEEGVLVKDNGIRTW